MQRAGAAAAHHDAGGVAPATLPRGADPGGDVVDVAPAPLPRERLGVRAAVARRSGRVGGEDRPAAAGEERAGGAPRHGRLPGRAAVHVDEQRRTRPRAGRRTGRPPEQPGHRRPLGPGPRHRLRLLEADGLEAADRATGDETTARRAEHGHGARRAGTGAHRGDPGRAPVEAVVPAGGARRDAVGADDDEPAEAGLVADERDRRAVGRPGVGPLPRTPRRLGLLAGLGQHRAGVVAVRCDGPHVPPAVAVRDEAEPAAVGRPARAGRPPRGRRPPRSAARARRGRRRRFATRPTACSAGPTRARPRAARPASRPDPTRSRPC